MLRTLVEGSTCAVDALETLRTVHSGAASLEIEFRFDEIPCWMLFENSIKGPGPLQNRLHTFAPASFRSHRSTTFSDHRLKPWQPSIVKLSINFVVLCPVSVAQLVGERDPGNDNSPIE